MLTQLKHSEVRVVVSSRGFRRILVALGFVAATLILTAGCGGDGAGEGDGEAAGEQASREDLRERLEAIRSVPYTQVTAEDADSVVTGVVKYDRDRAWKGYNLHCSLIRSEAYLTDMEGNILNRWTYPPKHMYTWEHVDMLPNGDLLVIRKFFELIRMDWDSNPIWVREVPAHHEITIGPDSSIYVVAKEMQVHRRMRSRFPAIVRLDHDGNELDRWSTFEHLDDIKAKFDQRPFIDTVLDSLIGDQVDPETWEPLTAFAESVWNDIAAWPKRYDQFHMNTINFIPDNPAGRKDPRFKEGNILICFRNVNQIGVLDWDTREITWAWGEGHLDWPHYPVMVENGNILIFDNGTKKRKYTRLIELNPLTEEIEWEYVGDPPESFYTPEKGCAQRLPNGNTLVCEGDMGHTFEITRNGEIVWDWYNPMMAGRKREQVYRMVRFAPEIVEPLLEKYGSR
jgi:hypothetical protein